MRRVLGTMGILMLGVGLAAGTAGGGTGDAGQDGYGVQVLGEEEGLPEGATLFALDFGADDEFGKPIPPGAFLDVEADGFMPESKGTVEVTSERRTLAFVTADDEGVILHRLQVPEDLPLGDHTLYVVGVDPDGEPRSVSMNIEVGFDEGGDSNWQAWTAGSIALALAVFGVGWWYVSRRRERETTTV